MQRIDSLRFHDVGGDDLIAYSHHVAAGTLIAGQIVERDDTILVVVNLHPTEAREGNVALDLGALGLADGVAFEVRDELDGALRVELSHRNS